MNKWFRVFINIVFVLVVIVNSILIVVQITQGMTIELFENLDWNEIIQISLPIILPNLCWIILIILIGSIVGFDLRKLFSNLTKFSFLGAEVEFGAETRQQLELAIRTYATSEDLVIKQSDLDRIFEHAKRARDDLKDARILWIDRNPLANANIHRFLNDLGIKIDNTDSNQQVLEAMEWSSGAYEVVITNMNHLNQNKELDSKAGLELINKMRNHEKEGVKNIKIILFIAAQPENIDVGFDYVTNEVDKLLIKVFEFIINERIDKNTRIRQKD